jgi:FkbM family methyltransferase
MATDAPPSQTSTATRAAQRRLEELLAAGPAVDGPTRWPVLGPLVRRLVLRASRHYTAYQAEIGQAVLECLHELYTLAGSRESPYTQTEAAWSWRRVSELADVLEAANGGSVTTEGWVGGWRRLLAQHLAAAEKGPSMRLLPPTIVEAATDVGSMLLPGHDRFITPLLRDQGTWEPEEAAFISSRLAPGRTFIDIGAHVGYHSLRAAKAVGDSGNVIAVEASPQTYALLCANATRNGCLNIFSVNAAAGKASGMAELTLSLDNTGGNRAYELDELAPAARIPCIALDDILPADLTIDLIKVDIEGMDHQALQGMEKSIGRCRPTVLTEFFPELIRSAKDEPVEVARYYRSLGYRLRTLHSDTDLSPEALLELAAQSPTGYFPLVLEPA